MGDATLITETPTPTYSCTYMSGMAMQRVDSPLKGLSEIPDSYGRWRMIKAENDFYLDNDL